MSICTYIVQPEFQSMPALQVMLPDCTACICKQSSDEIREGQFLDTFLEKLQSKSWHSQQLWHAHACPDPSPARGSLDPHWQGMPCQSSSTP